ncbi:MULTISPECIES: hypothetical protein [Bizionia]|uniref:Uncharacterized protein n=1 Tax=Bizionia algoritergicola TaxID=291187 RepID=A0A5D0R1B4_9FLAO|nr:MULTISPECIES: hypothetical protein [Bizionia]OBX24391.1 hypothetical protein BAA08_00935 [Bizionia sp. APA-3]TYB75313.1 hypothetical protein ES675_04075 [Bizionia algoritergicola]
MNKLLFFAILISTSVVFSQKAKVTEGDWSDLKGITEYNLVFDYSNLEIPKFDSEEEFLKDKMDKRDEKEPGSGEKFKASWLSDREDFYEPRFIETFNDRYKNNLVKVNKDLESAEYTMKIHTTMIYPGYNVGVIRHNSKIEVTLSVYKNENPENIIFSVDYTKIQGQGNGGFDFNSGQRIADAYIIFARALTKHMYKNTK